MQDYYFQNYETGVKFNDWPEFVKDVCCADQEPNRDRDIGCLNVLTGSYDYKERQDDRYVTKTKKFYYILDGKDLGDEKYQLKTGKVIDLSQDKDDKEVHLIENETDLCLVMLFLDNICSDEKNLDYASPYEVGYLLRRCRKNYDKAMYMDKLKKKSDEVVGKSNKQPGEEV